jgi:hypothetical protein
MTATEMVAGRAICLMDCSLVYLAAGELEAARRESAKAVSADPTGINSPGSLAAESA